MFGCRDAMVLEIDDIANFNVETRVDGGLTKVVLSGLAFHSSLGVDRISHVVNGSESVVIATLAIANAKRSGRFSYTMTIPAEVKTVRWGNKRTVVWQRPGDGGRDS